MKPLIRLGILALGALTALAPLSAQQKGVAAWQPVKDDIGFFSPVAKEHANQKVAELKRTYNKDLFIEAMKSPTTAKDIANDKKAQAAFFDQFAERRFAELHENGVYIMLIDDPHILRVVVGNNTRTGGYFTAENRTTLTQKMLEKLKAGNKDAALILAADYVADTMTANHPVVPRKVVVAPAAGGQGNAAPVERERGMGFNWSPIIMIVLVVAGVWIMLAIVRALFSRGGGGMGAPGMGGYGGGGGGGGGFFSSLLGGMFGAAAGMWMYNNVFGGHTGSSAWGAGSSDTFDKPTSYPDSGPADTSGSADGGDYSPDDAGGGGDVGGGDWGDAGGGGDFGGGGGDWGGGGGDFGGGGGGGDW